MKPSLDQVVEVIQRTGAGIVALQEVDAACPRTEGVHQAGEIGRRLGMSSLFCCLVDWQHFPPSPEPEGHYGLAFLFHSDLHLRRVDRWELPLISQQSEPRGVLQIEVEWRGTVITILNTHLSVQRPERVLQLRAIRDRVVNLDRQGRTSILMGDFNTFGISREMAQIRDIIPDCVPHQPPRATFPSRYPLLRLDRVFASSELVCRRSHVITSPLARQASDHLPVHVELTQ